MSSLEIREDDLSSAAIAGLLREHLDDMYAITPAESVHALDLEDLRAPGITFWSAWADDQLLGCGALKELDARNGEVKSMRTARSHRGKGVGSRILAHLVAEARRRAYTALFLETGSMPEFAPARALYARHGFVYRGPFAEYTEDPNCVFMVKFLADAT
jgi:putative acetyltransferase